MFITRYIIRTPSNLFIIVCSRAARQPSRAIRLNIKTMYSVDVIERSLEEFVTREMCTLLSNVMSNVIIKRIQLLKDLLIARTRYKRVTSKCLNFLSAPFLERNAYIA